MHIAEPVASALGPAVWAGRHAVEGVARQQTVGDRPPAEGPRRDHFVLHRPGVDPRGQALGLAQPHVLDGDLAHVAEPQGRSDGPRGAAVAAHGAPRALPLRLPGRDEFSEGRERG